MSFAAIAGVIAPVFGDLIDRAFPNSAEREQKKLEYELKLQEALNSIDLAQIEVNKVEAASTDRFVSGWRPFIGWVCSIAFAYHFIIQPFLAFAIVNLGGSLELPTFNMDALFTVLMGMLGLGGLRTIEKVKTNTNKLPWQQ
jgi:hypothetical protein